MSFSSTLKNLLLLSVFCFFLSCKTSSDQEAEEGEFEEEFYEEEGAEGDLIEQGSEEGEGSSDKESFDSLEHPTSPLTQGTLAAFMKIAREKYEQKSIRDQSQKVVALYKPMVQPEPTAVSGTESFLKEIGLNAHWVFYEIASEMIEQLEKSRGNPSQSKETLIVYTNSLKLTADHLDAQSKGNQYIGMAKDLYRDVMQTFFKHKFK
jgi:hypothetical protein